MNTRSDIGNIVIWDLTEVLKGLSYESTKALLSFREACLIDLLNPIENINRPAITVEYFYSLPQQAIERHMETVKMPPATTASPDATTNHHSRYHQRWGTLL